VEHLLWSLIPWGYQVLLTLETVRSGPLNVVMSIITDLGSNIGYLVVLSVVYWCVDKRAGRGLAYGSLVSATLNVWLKYIWNIPRPDNAVLEGVLRQAGIARRVAPLREATLPSFPSGHAQGAAVTWGYVAHRAYVGTPRRRWIWPAAATLIALVAFSRLYLGVHFPQDVIAGLAIGAGYLVVWLWAEPRVRTWLAVVPAGWRYALAVIAPMAMLLLQPGEDTAAATGALIGLGVGYLIEEQTLCFAVVGSWWQRALRGAFGLVLTLVAYFGLRALFGLVRVEGGVSLGWRTLRYALLGLTGAWGVPRAFVWSGLATVTKNGFCANRPT
jgi:membrane-associated phospholipid phosphatase